jgi:hypothetical protein
MQTNVTGWRCEEAEAPLAHRVHCDPSPYEYAAVGGIFGSGMPRRMAGSQVPVGGDTPKAGPEVPVVHNCCANFLEKNQEKMRRKRLSYAHVVVSGPRLNKRLVQPAW